ncbi:MAG: UPF0149 family protein [Alphaproteobacteria bacterium]|nr:UPF0149 family protein [Alphaproteobacteria bacterium]
MMLHTGDQLGCLAAVLDSVAQPEFTMTVGEFDGFAAGLLVCPDTVPPSDWLVAVWGEDPVFEHPEDADAALDALLGHYNRVARVLARDPAAYVPVFDMELHSGEVSWESWVAGFDRAMRLRASAWDAIGRSDDAAAVSLSLLIALSALPGGESGLSMEAVRRLDRDAPGMIPGFVRDLNAWSRSRQSGVAGAPEAGPGRGAAPRRVPRVAAARGPPGPPGDKGAGPGPPTRAGGRRRPRR